MRVGDELVDKRENVHLYLEHKEIFWSVIMTKIEPDGTFEVIGRKTFTEDDLRYFERGDTIMRSYSVIKANAQEIANEWGHEVYICKAEKNGHYKIEQFAKNLTPRHHIIETVQPQEEE